MMEEIATVVVVREGGVEVACFSKSACGQCRQSSQCGTGIVAKALPGREHRFFVPTTLTLQAGQQVRIGIPEPSVIGGALLVYLLPLLSLLASALAGHFLQGEAGSILGALLGGTGGFLLAARLARRASKQHGPVLLGPLIPVMNAD